MATHEKTQEDSKVMFELLSKHFNDEQLAIELGVTPKSIFNYKKGATKTKGVIKKIKESYEKLSKIETPINEIAIVGEISIEDFRNVYRQGIIVAEAHRNFSIAAIKTAEAEIIKAEATRTFADTGKKQTDNNSELVGLLKKFFIPVVNSETPLKNQASPWVSSIDPESMAQAGVPHCWDTIEEGKAEIGKMLLPKKKAQGKGKI